MSFTDRLLGDSAGFVQVVMAAMGDRLGLWHDLAAHGPATSIQLARRMGHLPKRNRREHAAYLVANLKTWHFLKKQPSAWGTIS